MACTPHIDTSSVCAVLFWMMTKRHPKESRNIHGEAPHQRKDHDSTIAAELIRATGVWNDTEKRRPLEQHLQLIFNRGFSFLDQQWSTEELLYQLQHMLRLVMKNNEESSVLRRASSKKQAGPSLPNSFLQLASLIDWMKGQFQMHYSDVHWSIDVENEWRGHGRQVKNRDILTVQKQDRLIKIKMICCAEINENQELILTIIAIVNGMTDIQLPLGVWKQYEQENVKEEVLKTFELELKTLIDILCQNKAYVIS